jgi:hypothetical protein
MITTFYAIIFLTPDEPYLHRFVTNVPNPDAGSAAEEILSGVPHALSIILIDQNFKVVNEYRSPLLA